MVWDAPWGKHTQQLCLCLAASDGFLINGFADASGWSVSGAGDVNGDGLADVLVGTTSTRGDTYVVFGKTSGTTVQLSTLTAASPTDGFVIRSSTDKSSIAGESVSYAGDINGDGLADFIIASGKADPTGKTDAGKVYVMYGKTDTTAVDLTTLAAGSGGFVINGQAAGDYLGGAGTAGSTAVSYAGDLNGDGYDDLIISAQAADPASGADAGKTYILYGGQQYVSGAIATGMGTGLAELVIGTSGNDTLTGGGGVDRFSAGLGNDNIVLTVSDITNLASTTPATAVAYVEGGNGYDSITLSGAANLDLTAIKNASAGAYDGSSRINNIERISLGSDAVSNTLTLAANDVNDMAGMNLIRTGSTSADGKTWTNVSALTVYGNPLTATSQFHQLVVDGNSSDALVLQTGIGYWFKSGEVSNGTTNYYVYQNNTTHTQVMVDKNVVVIQWHDD